MWAFPSASKGSITSSLQAASDVAHRVSGSYKGGGQQQRVAPATTPAAPDATPTTPIEGVPGAAYTIDNEEQQRHSSVILNIAVGIDSSPGSDPSPLRARSMAVADAEYLDGLESSEAVNDIASFQDIDLPLPETPAWPPAHEWGKSGDEPEGIGAGDRGVGGSKRCRYLLPALQRHRRPLLACFLLLSALCISLGVISLAPRGGAEAPVVAADDASVDGDAGVDGDAREWEEVDGGSKDDGESSDYRIEESEESGVSVESAESVEFVDLEELTALPLLDTAELAESEELVESEELAALPLVDVGPGANTDVVLEQHNFEELLMDEVGADKGSAQKAGEGGVHKAGKGGAHKAGGGGAHKDDGVR